MDQDRVKLTTIELAQVPVASATFQLRHEIGYYEGMGEAPPHSDIIWAHRHEPRKHPTPGNRTDLASVPSVFWSLIASYGRQTAPAIVHDSECWKVFSAQYLDQEKISGREAVQRRIQIDRRFRLGLRELRVAPFRSWLMWTFVALERYQKHAVGALIGFLFVGILGLLLVAGSLVAVLTFGLPLWVGLLMIFTPLATSAIGGQWQMLVWFSYAGALMLPVVVLQFAAYLPYLLLENVIWFIVDGRHGHGAPVLGLTDVKTIRRASAT
ncbi:MAG: DUF1353 domain-containing protein [Rhodoglobus sp.]